MACLFLDQSEIYVCIYPTPLFKQDATQGQFLSRI